MEVAKKLQSTIKVQGRGFYRNKQVVKDEEFLRPDQLYIDKEKIGSLLSLKDKIKEEYSLTEAKRIQNIINCIDNIIEPIQSLIESIGSLHIEDEKSKDKLKVTLDGKLIIKLPHQFRSLYDSIEESKYILELKENWDDEGASPYEESTWRRAVEFICNCSVRIFSETNKIIDAPEIHPGPNGNIDLLWKKETYRLLINIPENSEKLASYYGDDYKSQTSKGAFNTSSYTQGLLGFLSLLL